MCWYCGSALPENIFFRDLCPTCGKEMHVCKHCVFYKPGLSNDCAESQAENVQEKERMNFCDYFKLEPSRKFDSKDTSKAKSAKDDFNKLFDF